MYPVKCCDKLNRDNSRMKIKKNLNLRRGYDEKRQLLRYFGFESKKRFSTYFLLFLF